MVQILPQATSLGAQLGQALQSSLSQGGQQGAQMGFQRGMLQNALKSIENPPAGTSPFQLASSLIQATAGIPGAERYVAPLFQLLQGQLRGQQSFFNPGAPAQAGAAAPGAATPGAPSQEGQAQGGQFQDAGGFLSPPMTSGETKNLAERYALGDPSKIPEGLQIGQSLNQTSEQAKKWFEDRAAGLGITKDEMPYFMQMAQSSSEKNPEKLLIQTKRNFDQLRSLDNALVPGITRGVLQKTPGLIPMLIAGTEPRSEALNRIQAPIDALVKAGQEPIVRKKLGELGLSPTEVEERIHPPSKEFIAKLDNFPKPSKSADTREKMLIDFFDKNIQKGDSLLVMRNKLWKDKGYNWQEINSAMQKAISQGLPLTTDQNTELVELSRPPRESLVDIFRNWDQFSGYLRGQK